MDANRTSTLLVALLVVPAIAGAAVALLRPAQAKLARVLSLGATVICLVLALIIAAEFIAIGNRTDNDDAKGPSLHPTFHPEFIPGAPYVSKDAAGRVIADWHRTSWELFPIGEHGAVQFFIGVDGLNIWLVVLTTVLMVPSVLVSWTSVQERVGEFHAWLLLLMTGMIGVFVAFDIILFYVFFELTLVPLFFLIGMWGGPERRHAARKFFIYTLAGSLITLLGLLAIVLACYQFPVVENGSKELTFSIPRLVELMGQHLDPSAPDAAAWQTFQIWVFLALIAGFAIKVPLVPLHTWLPLAHVEAPTAGSVLLAGVLLKIGAYGFLRLCLPLTPDASLTLGVPLIGTLAVIGIIYGALCAYAQEDIKKLVAYSSVSHLGFCMLGMFALNVTGLSGSLMQMINHGLSTGALFLLVGMLYERYHTRKMSDYGGMGARLGMMSCFFVFIVLTSIGLPGLNGFVGEVLVLLGMFAYHGTNVSGPVLAVIAASGIVLGAWYLLTMLRRVFFGPVKEPHHEGDEPVGDLNGRELAALLPIAALCVFLGVYPEPILDSARPDLTTVTRIADLARERAKQVPEKMERPRS
jgi:NADH-quinone oxidoreductase subunit M